MNQFQQLDHMLMNQDGMLRTRQVFAAGISKPGFYKVCAVSRSGTHFSPYTTFEKLFSM